MKRTEGQSIRSATCRHPRASAQERSEEGDAREDGGGGLGLGAAGVLDRVREAAVAGDSGFSVLFSDAPDPDEVHGPDDLRISLVCLHCLIDDDPELGRGLDIAREYGVADLDENGEWVHGRGQEAGRPLG